MQTERSYHHGNLRAALIGAAEAELADRGIEGFSLRGVARRAGVSHAAPAHHFGDAQGLLTALAADGFRRFVATQEACQAEARPDPRDALVAAGLGYVSFATDHPALFRLMFASNRPDHADAELHAAAGAAYRKLEADVAARTGRAAPDPLDVMAAWSAAHGVADLLVSGRAFALQTMTAAERKAAIRTIIERAVPGA